MSTKKTAADDKKATTVVANDPDDLKGTLKHIGGSKSDCGVRSAKVGAINNGMAASWRSSKSCRASRPI